jgi:hypothetical protein
VHQPTVQKYTSGFNPNCNGSIERANSTIKQYLRAYCSSGNPDWDLLIPSCQFSLNTKVHSTTGKMPYELLYNRIPYTYMDREIGFQKQIPKANEKLFNLETQQRYKKEIEKVKNKILDKQIRAAKHYNSKHRQPIYLIGDLVMIKNRHLNPNRHLSLQSKYEGPYIVIMRCGKNTYLLQDVLNPDIHRKVNVRLMLSYYSNDQKFLISNPLPEKYLANIDMLDVEYDSEFTESESDSTIIYYEDKNDDIGITADNENFHETNNYIMLSDNETDMNNRELSYLTDNSDNESRIDKENLVFTGSYKKDRNEFTRTGRRRIIPKKFDDFVLYD